MIAPLDICTKSDVLFKNSPRDFSLKTILNSLEKFEVKYVSPPILSISTINLLPSLTPLLQFFIHIDSFNTFIQL